MNLIHASAARKQRADKWMRFYADQQSDDTLALIAQKWSQPETFRVFQVNIVKKIVNKRANLYRLQPRRTFDGLDQEAGDAIYRTVNADVILKRASRLTKLLKTCALQVGWNGTRATLAVATPNILDVMAPDPENPERVVVTHRAARAADTTYSDWTRTSYFRRDYRGVPVYVEGNPGSVNPYGIVPFVPLFDRYPDDAFWLPGGEDLIEAQEAVNVALSNLWRSVEMQAHGQPWASGLGSTDDMRVGPERVIGVPEGGTFGFAAPNSPIAGILSAIEFLMRQTAGANDVSADVFDLDRSSESGAAKHVEQIDLKEARLDDVALWRSYEARLWDVLKVVVNTNAPGTIPADATMSVDFAELQDPISETERLTNARARVDMGVWSPADVLRSENPDGFPTREDAMRELRSRKAETARTPPDRIGPHMTTPTDPAPEPTPVAAEPTPAPVTPPATPDPIVAMVAELATLRAEFAALKTTPPAPVVVPPTDQGKPTITPITIDPSSLPPLARMAAGYRK